MHILLESVQFGFYTWWKYYRLWNVMIGCTAVVFQQDPANLYMYKEFNKLLPSL